MVPWALLGLTFAIFWRLGRVSFFDAFFDRQKVGAKSPKSAKLATKRRADCENGVARRNARATGEGV